MKKTLLILISIIAVQQIVAQSIPIFKWQDHLSYKSGVSVAEGSGKVYCATKSGIFMFNNGDNSMERLSKINGLSDVQAVVLNCNHYNNKVLIAYANANIDIINGTTITNLPDIKNKNIVGNKAINNIYFINQFAYLACGFGIVVVDMNRMEIHDTYYIGPGGNAINVRDITSDANYFYAATDGGVYRASVTAPTLADNSAWSLITGVVNNVYSGNPNGKYNAITVFNGKVFANFSRFLYSIPGSDYSGQDTIKSYDGTKWKIDSLVPLAPYTIRVLRTVNWSLIVADQYSINIRNSNLQGGFYLGGTDCFNDALSPESVTVDSYGGVWYADDKYGLASWKPGIGCEHRYPNGPANEFVTAMAMAGGNLMAVPGGVSNSWSNLYINDGIFDYSNTNWTNIKGSYPSVVNLDTLYDFMNVLIDSNDTKHAYVASWGGGVIELYNGIPVKHWDANTSHGGLNGIYSNGSGPVLTDGLALDAGSNLWVGSTSVRKALSRKSLTGTWTTIDFTSIFGGNGATMGQMIIDQNDQKWIVLSRGGGLMVYAGNTTAAANVATNTKVMTTATGHGKLPSTGVYCVAEDKTGEIWVGTDKGIAVFYSPENVFVSGQNYDAQQILLQQDGNVQILLLTETVQAIAVDDANRKWIGTANSGVFLMSADGTQQIYHFDVSNSPMFSNNVTSIAIDHKTGEVYFGTGKGIIEFRGSSTAGNQDYSGIYAFPNPVKPNYDGPIAITGLVGSSIVKITDVVGNLVFQTTSEGGQALWYGKNFKGEKVSTGVYMVFCASQDGSQKAVTKIVFIN